MPSARHTTVAVSPISAAFARRPVMSNGLPDPQRPDEFEAAFRLLYQYLPATEQLRRIASALSMVASGELDASTVAVLRRHQDVTGVMVFAVVPGGSGIVWPPQVADSPSKRVDQDALINHALTKLREASARFAQCLLPPDELAEVAPLERHGFRRITTLIFLRHFRERPSRTEEHCREIRLLPFADADAELFSRAMEESNSDTLDCPEIQGLRTPAEVLEGYRAEAGADPGLWWLAFLGEDHAG